MAWLLCNCVDSSQNNRKKLINSIDRAYKSGVGLIFLVGKKSKSRQEGRNIEFIHGMT